MGYTDVMGIQKYFIMRMVSGKKRVVRTIISKPPPTGVPAFMEWNLSNIGVRLLKASRVVCFNRWKRNEYSSLIKGMYRRLCAKYENNSIPSKKTIH